MVQISSYPVAILLCFLAMVCWGSWQNTQNFAGKGWRFESFYWDYSLGILLMSLLYAFTLGSMGSEGRTFINDVAQASLQSLAFAAFAGVIWNLGTLLLVNSIAIAGMATAFTIGGGLAWLLGIILNFREEPAAYKTNQLLVGLGLIVITLLVSYFAYKRLADKQKKPTFKAVVMAICTGILVASYYLIMVKSLDRDFLPVSAGKLTSYTAVVFFSIGAFISTFIFNPIFMRKPVQGEPVTVKDYFKGTRKAHLLGIFGGMIWCSGNAFSFMAANTAGPAISYGLSNAAPLIAAIWGVFIWKEFKDAPKGTNILLVAMFALYIISLIIITTSKV